MRYDTPEAFAKVHECAVIAAREAVATLNALEALKQPSRRIYYSLDTTSARQREREALLHP